MSKKISQEIINPDKDLSPRQIYKLNKEFYENYYTDYFATKLFILGSMFSNSDDFLNIINENDVEVGVYQVDSDTINVEKSEIIKFVKLELSILYYHCIETFLRLFIAHSEFKQCPWLELSRYTDYRKFKKKIHKMSKGKFDFAYDKLDPDQIVTYILYGTEDLGEMELPGTITKELALETLKEWIIWSSKELLNVYDYNSYKHGLTVYSDSKGFELVGKDGKKIKEHGEGLVFLNKVKKVERYKWQKTFIFTPLDYRAVMVHILQGLIRNIINIGKRTYLEEADSLDIVFVGSKPYIFYDPVKTENPLGLTVKSYSVELEYIKKD